MLAYIKFLLELISLCSYYANLGNELDLTLNVWLFYTLNLSFSNHVHRLVTLQCPRLLYKIEQP